MTQLLNEAFDDIERVVKNKVQDDLARKRVLDLHSLFDLRTPASKAPQKVCHKEASFTKKGPGRKHSQGLGIRHETDERGRTFTVGKNRGVTKRLIARPLSSFHPTVLAARIAEGARNGI